MNNDQTDFSRRQLLRTSLALGSGITLANTMPTSWLAGEEPRTKQNAVHGIAELHLHSTKVHALQRFYEQDLGLATRKQGGELTVEAGATRIIFESVDERHGEPFYHVAFNIPENKLADARRWQEERTELIRLGNSDVIHFSRWNAHSVFFRDPAGNLLEYIARHDLNNQADGNFTPTDILYASEIGLVVDDVPKTVAAVKKTPGTWHLPRQQRRLRFHRRRTRVAGCGEAESQMVSSQNETGESVPHSGPDSKLANPCFDDERLWL